MIYNKKIPRKDNICAGFLVVFVNSVISIITMDSRAGIMKSVFCYTSIVASGYLCATRDCR